MKKKIFLPKLTKSINCWLNKLNYMFFFIFKHKNIFYVSFFFHFHFFSLLLFYYLSWVSEWMCLYIYKIDLREESPIYAFFFMSLRSTMTMKNVYNFFSAMLRIFIAAKKKSYFFFSSVERVFFRWFRFSESST